VEKLYDELRNKLDHLTNEDGPLKIFSVLVNHYSNHHSTHVPQGFLLGNSKGTNDSENSMSNDDWNKLYLSLHLISEPCCKLMEMLVIDKDVQEVRLHLSYS